MITIHDSIAGDEIEFNFVENVSDAHKAFMFARSNRSLALDTESTGLNCYHPEWQLRTFQFGHATTSFIVSAKAHRVISKILELDIKWIGHNGPHDIRCLDKHLGYETGVICAGETYLPSHHHDPRNQDEGGISHGLKEQAVAYIDPMAGKWEAALKREFKTIKIEIPGEVYKSGKRKGTQKYRVAKISEGYGLINPTNLVYLAYAGSDTILTFRLWRHYQKTVRQFIELYRFDHRVQLACDRLQRRGILLDVPYTTKYHKALDKSSIRYAEKANKLGCKNIYSPVQLTEALLKLGANLTDYTDKGSLKADDKVMQYQLKNGNAEVKELVHNVLAAKRRAKRREAYADAMLRERDSQGRVHPSINSLGARTTRMSVSNPALQQLPTREGEE